MDRDANGPTVADLVKHIQCEVAKAVDQTANSKLQIASSGVSTSDGSQSIDKTAVMTLGDYFKKHGYVGQVSLTVDVIDTQAINPSLSFINPITSATNFTMSFAGQYSQTRHRSFNYYFPIKLVPVNATSGTDGSEAVAAPGGELCREDKMASNNKSGFQGTLGLDTALYSGVLANIATSDSEDLSETDLSKQQNLSFTTQVDFQVVWSGGLGPNWTLTRFKGPSGGGGGGGGGSGGGGSGGGGSGGGGSQLFNASNTGKDTLIVAFAPIGDAKASAARAELEEQIKIAKVDVASKQTQKATNSKHSVATLLALEAERKMNLDRSPAAIATRKNPAALNDLNTLSSTLDMELNHVENENANAPRAARSPTQATLDAIRQQKSADEKMVAEAKVRLTALQDRENTLKSPNPGDVAAARDAASAALTRYLLEGLQPRLR
ncbi:hypothetical protein [Caballeronia sp. KNU42]